uniref:Proline dehydrogenase n=1 Tax=Colobus angolensis palliatus TaxID=336983 RepID=A0A2K5JJD3_COLAP
GSNCHKITAPSLGKGQLVNLLMLRTCYLLCSQAGPLARGCWQPLSFDGGAFHLKGTGELTRALLVLRLCAWPPLVTHGLALQAWSQRLLGSRLSGAFLRASIYGQFVAGETAEEVRGCVQQLRTLSLRPLLAVPTEEEPDSAAKSGEAWYEGNLGAMLRCVDLSRDLLEPPSLAEASLMQLKVTALTSARLCKELASWVRRPGASLELSPERLAEAMDSGQVRIASGTVGDRVPRTQMRPHGTPDCWDYRLEPPRPATSLTFSSSPSLHCSHTGLLHDTQGLGISCSHCLGHSHCRQQHGPIPHLLISLLLGTFSGGHRDSPRLQSRCMWELGIPLDGTVCFGQLLGMCDHVSLALGQAGYVVYKSIPYGSLEEVIPYLIRRAQENRSVLQGVRREQELLSQELWRRLLPGCRRILH